MTLDELEKNLVNLYGDTAFSDTLVGIKELQDNSNIPFDAKYVALGLNFVSYKVEEILSGSKNKCSLKSLLSESFGEAAIYKYNCCGGVL